MSQLRLIATVMAVSLVVAGAAHAQSATTTNRATTAPAATAPSNPPERMTGASTANNPATATTPQPGATTATPGDATSSSRTAAHADTTPATGANSFTEGQARSRIQDSGFAEVSELKLDNQGVWRAKATKDGKSVEVALDFKGNVVAQ